MKRKIVALAFCFSGLLLSLNAYSLPSFLAFFAPTKTSCARAVPTSDSGFCSSFADVAKCHCSASLPDGMCQNMKDIYERMISVFKSQQAACEWQKDVSTQECMDDWNCYRLGGKDSNGNLCSGTGRAC